MCIRDRASIKAHLAFFSEWIGDKQPIDSITSLKLTEFYNLSLIHISEPTRPY